MNEALLEEFESDHECNYAIHSPAAGRFRISAFYQRNQEGIVLRRIETHIPTCDDLSLPDTIKQLAMSKRGLIILVGATVAGKSTSLAALYRLCTGEQITYDAAIASADSANDLRLMIKLAGSAPRRIRQYWGLSLKTATVYRLRALICSTAQSLFDFYCAV